MRTFLISVLVVFFFVQGHAQDAKSTVQQKIQVGDELIIGPSETKMYKYVDFPKPNFIIKRGGIANYKKVRGTKVVVTAFKTKKDGTELVRIKRVDGARFFGSHTSVMANLEKALASGELQII